MDDLHGRKLTVQLFAPDYRIYEQPSGFLNSNKACHALWHYFLAGRLAYEREMENIVYEGDKDKTTNLRQLFLGVAKLYAVLPEDMIKFWPNVDMQATSMGLPKMPDTDDTRFNKPIEITT